MASLYEINADMQDAIMRATLNAEANDGVIDDSIVEELEQLELDREIKIDNTCLYIKNLESEIGSISVEEKKLKARRLSAEKILKNVKSWLKFNLNGETRTTGAYKLSYRKSVSTKVIDADKIPQKFLKVKTTFTPSLNDIKKAIQSGEDVDGVELIENVNLNIK